jgi:hypothetical protein
MTITGDSTALNCFSFSRIGFGVLSKKNQIKEANEQQAGFQDMDQFLTGLCNLRQTTRLSINFLYKTSL